MTAHIPQDEPAETQSLNMPIEITEFAAADWPTISEIYREGLSTGIAAFMADPPEREGFWTLQAQMMTENTASRELHRKAGFREVGIRERYGHLNGV